MPFINTKTTASISKEQETLLKEKMGAAISLIGKSESRLMVNFEDKCRLYFKGDNSKDIAIAEIALFGKASDSQYDALTGKLTEEISEVLRIDPSNIYINYEEVDHWGYNGFNF